MPAEVTRGVSNAEKFEEGAEDGVEDVGMAREYESTTHKSTRNAQMQC